MIREMFVIPEIAMTRVIPEISMTRVIPEISMTRVIPEISMTRVILAINMTLVIPETGMTHVTRVVILVTTEKGMIVGTEEGMIVTGAMMVAARRKMIAINVIHVTRRRTVTHVIRRRTVTHVIRRQVVILVIRRRIVIHVTRRRTVTHVIRRVVIHVIRRRIVVAIAILMFQNLMHVEQEPTILLVLANNTIMVLAQKQFPTVLQTITFFQRAAPVTMQPLRHLQKAQERDTIILMETSVSLSALTSVKEDVDGKRLRDKPSRIQTVLLLK